MQPDDTDGKANRGRVREHHEASHKGLAQGCSHGLERRRNPLTLCEASVVFPLLAMPMVVLGTWKKLRR